MNREQSALWQRICDFQIDDANASFPFSARLASEQGWALAYARRVINEYKRFVFLAMVADHEVTPSKVVDEAWHLHLTYTRSYWDHFCPQVLRRPLHHLPTRGDVDAPRHRDQYAKTLASYRAWFSEEPPADFWPVGTGRRELESSRGRCDAADAWVIAKPAFGWWRRTGTPAAGVSLCVLPVMIAIANPFNLSGPEFLTFYACLIAVAALIAWFLRNLLRSDEDHSTAPLTPYQVACLARGTPGVVQAAIVSLVDRKAVELGLSKVEGVGRKDYRLKNRAGLPDNAEELDLHILAASNMTDGSRLGPVLQAAQPAAEKVQHRLEAWGLLTPSDRVNTCQWVPFLLMATVVAVGVIKIIIGMSRERPVLFLLLLVIAAAVIAALFLWRPLRTRAGDEMLTRIRRGNATLPSGPMKEQQPLSGSDLILAAALFGLPAIASGELAAMPQAWKYRDGPTQTGYGCGSGGSGGCGGGGGGGGGGCGGGGCGGCGGGGS